MLNKKILICLLSLILTSVSSLAQETTVKKEEQAKTILKPHNEGWLVKVDEAYEESKKTGKPILANFTGSDWCGWCIKLTREVFSKPEFKEWAKENVVLLELDFPRRKQLPPEIKKQNFELQQAFKVTGYPTIWIFNLEKNSENQQFSINALGKTGYVGGGPANWTKNADLILKNNVKKEETQDK